MRKIAIIGAVIIMFTIGNAMAQILYHYEVAPAGGKNFTTAVGIPPTATISLDIYLTGVTAPQNAGCAWLDFTGSTDDIAYVSGGRCMLDGSEGCTGPWTNGAGALIGEPAGPGTIFYIVANLGGAAPDVDGDLIVGTVTLQNTGPNDATVDINTTASSCWTPISNIDVGSGAIVISQILDDEDEDGIQDDQDNCPNMPNGPLLGTCINVYNGVVGTTCLNDGECGTGETCSNNQEDRDNNGSGDACDIGTFCRGLADYDQDVDALDVTMFLSHFGRSPFNNPCPPDGPAPVPETSAGRGNGVPWPNPRFTDNDDGTVADNLTGLIWLKDANCFGQRMWLDAVSDSNGLASGSCGLTDGSNAGEWRLPQIKELESLIDFENYVPALPTGHPFFNVLSSYYWSSTTGAFDSESVWLLGMGDGGVLYSDKTIFSYVWPVRGGH